jgi:hypothetical protein
VHRWEDNIKVFFKKNGMGKCGLASCVLGSLPVGCCEHENELLNSIKGGKFLDWPRKYY